MQGKLFTEGEHVVVRKQSACPQGGVVLQVIMRVIVICSARIFIRALPTTQSNHCPAPTDATLPPTNAHLWRGGVLGGHAVVHGWRYCSHNASRANWHGPNVLAGVPWRVDQNDASILLLGMDGYAGLDLSFATHLFLLDDIKDSAVLQQVISRAHRIGAEGAVNVQLVQVLNDNSDNGV